LDYIVPGLLGFLTGAVIYGLTYDDYVVPILKITPVGNVNMPDLWNVSPFLFILMFALMSLLLFYLIERVGWQRKSSDQ
jgi:hypothetical protein